jgi:hypothetical protein
MEELRALPGSKKDKEGLNPTADTRSWLKGDMVGCPSVGVGSGFGGGRRSTEGCCTRVVQPIS